MKGEKHLLYYGAGAVVSIGALIALDGHIAYAEGSGSDLPINPEDVTIEVPVQSTEQNEDSTNPPPSEQEQEETEAEVAPETVEFSDDIIVQNPLGPSEEQQDKNTEASDTNDSSHHHQRESRFKNLPFSTSAEANSSIDNQGERVNMVESAVQTAVAFIAPTNPEPVVSEITDSPASPTKPIEITTNAPATISISDDGIHVEVADIDSSVAVPEAEPEQEPVPAVDLPEPVLPTPQAEPTESAPVLPTPTAEAPEGELTSYEQYLLNLPEVAEPAHFAELRAQANQLEPAARYSFLKQYYREYNDWLFSNVTPTAEGYAAFKESGVNRDFTDAFADEKTIINGETINPSCIVIHWMAGSPADIPTFAAQMRYGVQFALGKDAIIYQTTPLANSKTYHAAGANDMCIGLEMDGRELMDMTPKKMLSVVYWIKNQSEELGIPIKRNIEAIEASPLNSFGDYIAPDDVLRQNTLWTHMEVDRVLAEHPKGKVDLPTITGNGLYKKYQELESALSGNVVPTEEPATVQPAEQPTGQSTLVRQDSTSASYIEEQASTQAPVASALQRVMNAPILTAEQVALLERSKTHGFTGSDEEDKEKSQGDETAPESVPVTEPIQPAPEIEPNNKVLSEMPDEIRALLSPEFFDTTVDITPVQAYARSVQSVMNGGTLPINEAYGTDVAKARDLYIAERWLGMNENAASVMTAVPGRETGYLEEAVGDPGEHPEKGLQPDTKASFGLFQMRNMNDGSPLRDPARNLISMYAVENAVDVFEQNGGAPWEVTVPDVLTEESLFQAIRLANRDLGVNRPGFDARMRKVAHDVFVMQQETEPLIAAALGETA